MRNFSHFWLFISTLQYIMTTVLWGVGTHTWYILILFSSPFPPLPLHSLCFLVHFYLQTHSLPFSCLSFILFFYLYFEFLIYSLVKNLWFYTSKILSDFCYYSNFTRTYNYGTVWKTNMTKEDLFREWTVTCLWEGVKPLTKEFMPDTCKWDRM